MTEHLRKWRDDDLPSGGSELLRWIVFLTDRFGVAMIGAAFLCWYIVAQNNGQRQERESAATSLAALNSQVLSAFKENATALNEQSNAILTLSHAIEANTAEMRGYQSAKKQ
jgi:hypothetical protein